MDEWFSSAKLRKCWESEGAFITLKVRFGSHFSLRRTVWWFEKGNKTNMQLLLWLLVECTGFTNTYTCVFSVCQVSACASEGRCLCACNGQVSWVTEATYVFFFFLLLHELRWAETFKAVFAEVIPVHLHGYTQKATRHVELCWAMIDKGKTKGWVRAQRGMSIEKSSRVLAGLHGLDSGVKPFICFDMTHFFKGRVFPHSSKFLPLHVLVSISKRQKSFRETKQVPVFTLTLTQIPVFIVF